MSKNERITERLTLKLLKGVGIFEYEEFLVEEQKSENPVITKLLKNPIYFKMFVV